MLARENKFLYYINTYNILLAETKINHGLNICNQSLSKITFFL